MATNLSVVHAAGHPTEMVRDVGKSGQSNYPPLQLTWVGLSGGCKGKRLNSQPLSTGTDLAVGLEKIMPDC